MTAAATALTQTQVWVISIALSIPITLALLGLAYLAARAAGLTYRRTGRLPATGTFLHYTLDEHHDAIANGDGTVTLNPHRVRLTLRSAVYLYGPNRTGRGRWYNHASRKPDRTHWSAITITAGELTAAIPHGATVRRRRWDDAYAITTREPLTVSATVTRSIALPRRTGSTKNQHSV